jgi:hypothetical protein
MFSVLRLSDFPSKIRAAWKKCETLITDIFEAPIRLQRWEEEETNYSAADIEGKFNL